MKETSEQASIRCPIGLFLKQEAQIARLTQAINQVRTVAEKTPYAQELMEAVDELLACQAYDGQDLNCRLCRSFSELRRKTAGLVVKVGRLSR